MPYVSVHVDASEVLEDLDDEDIQKEVERRERTKAPVGCAATDERYLLEQIWMHYRNQADVPYCLREYLWRVLGKAL